MRKYKACVLFPNNLSDLKDGDIGSLETLTQAAKASGIEVDHEIIPELVPYLGATTALGWLEEVFDRPL